jgi:hypothetical protein
MLVIVPIVIMSFFRDRKERYLLPMIAPAAIIAARAVTEHLDTRAENRTTDRAVLNIHWAGVIAIAAGFPLAAALHPALKRADGTAWLSLPATVVAMLIAIGLIATGLALRRRFAFSVVVFPALMMLAMQAFFMHSYRYTREGMSEIKSLAKMIWERAPDAVVFTTGPHKKLAPNDLSIYLSRTIRWLPQYPDPATADPRTLAVVRRDDDDETVFPPSGWREIARAERDKSWWYALVPDTPRKRGG